MGHAHEGTALHSPSSKIQYNTFPESAFILDWMAKRADLAMTYLSRPTFGIGESGEIPCCFTEVRVQSRRGLLSHLVRYC